MRRSRWKRLDDCSSFRLWGAIPFKRSTKVDLGFGLASFDNHRTVKFHLGIHHQTIMMTNHWKIHHFAIMIIDTQGIHHRDSGQCSGQAGEGAQPSKVRKYLEQVKIYLFIVRFKSGPEYDTFAYLAPHASFLYKVKQELFGLFYSLSWLRWFFQIFGFSPGQSRPSSRQVTRQTRSKEPPLLSPCSTPASRRTWCQVLPRWSFSSSF